jgi:tyrosinase
VVRFSDRIHGGLGGVMGTLESSFHPIFWLHHNNIDRFYQKYIEMHPDSTCSGQH